MTQKQSQIGFTENKIVFCLEEEKHQNTEIPQATRKRKLVIGKYARIRRYKQMARVSENIKTLTEPSLRVFTQRQRVHQVTVCNVSRLVEHDQQSVIVVLRKVSPAPKPEGFDESQSIWKRRKCRSLPMRPQKAVMDSCIRSVNGISYSLSVCRLFRMVSR